MALTTVNPGDFVEFDHPETGRTEYGTVIAATPLRVRVRTGAGVEYALAVGELYDPARPLYAAAA